MSERPVKLSCEAVWKVFGKGAARFLESRGGQASLDDLAGAGLIGAVRDANLAVREGEIFIIMGLSGSGKSTLVRCMSRLIEPSAGKVLFEGEDLLAKPENELIEIRRHKMGMVFQHFALLPHLTVLGNVAFPAGGAGHWPRRARSGARCEVIELVGLDGREAYYPRELSGGQQQRVGIARSLAVEPEIWFLDEPFSALDPLIRREMQDEFLRLQVDAAQDHCLHHPRLRRGRAPGRPDRHHEGRRDHPDRHAGGTGDITRRPPTSPSSPARFWPGPRCFDGSRGHARPRPPPEGAAGQVDRRDQDAGPGSGPGQDARTGPMAW